MTTFIGDLRYGMRMLLRSPGLTLAAVLSLALGIGANAAIFSYVDALWLRPLAVRDSARLVKVFTSENTSSGENLYGATSNPDYQDLRQQLHSITDLAAEDRRGALLNLPGQMVQLLCDVVSPNYFRALGVNARVGRTFSEQDASAENSPAVVVIGYSFWQNQYGGDPAIVGKTIVVDGVNVTVLGVLPRAFRGGEAITDVQLFVPTSTWKQLHGGAAPELTLRDDRRYDVYGYLAPGTSLAQAQAELNTIAARLAESYPKSNARLKYTVVPEADSHGSERGRLGTVLLGIAGLVLLIACANVANLLLARSEARRREIATRLALGASRVRMVRQLMTESLLLAICGGASALVLGAWIIGLLPALNPPTAYSVGLDTRLDFRVATFALASAVVATFIFGLIPALRSTRSDLYTGMKGAAQLAGSRKLPLRNVVVVMQVALSVLVVASAGLLARTLINALELNPGFDQKQQLLIVNLVPGLSPLKDAQYLDYYNRAIAAAESLPAVRSAAFAMRLPMGESGGGATHDVLLPQSAAGETPAAINYAWVSPGYFRTMGTRLLRGRDFTLQDTAASPRVAVINQSLAQRLWPDQDALGRHVLVGRKRLETTVVGLVEDGKYNALTEPSKPYFFVPFTQEADAEGVLLVATNSDARSLIAPLRRKLAGVDATVPVTATYTLDQHMKIASYEQRVSAALVGCLGLLGLTLASLGLYGVISYWVNRRTREIGIRVALGAMPRNIFRGVAGQGMRLAVLGVVIGLVATAAATQVLRNFLYGVSPHDPVSLMIAAVILLSVALLASAVPAQRAARVDPMVALRYE